MENITDFNNIVNHNRHIYIAICGVVYVPRIKARDSKRYREANSRVMATSWFINRVGHRGYELEIIRPRLTTESKTNRNDYGFANKKEEIMSKIKILIIGTGFDGCWMTDRVETHTMRSLREPIFKDDYDAPVIENDYDAPKTTSLSRTLFSLITKNKIGGKRRVARKNKFRSVAVGVCSKNIFQRPAYLLNEYLIQLILGVAQGDARSARSAFPVSRFVKILCLAAAILCITSLDTSATAASFRSNFLSAQFMIVSIISTVIGGIALIMLMTVATIINSENNLRRLRWLNERKKQSKLLDFNLKLIPNYGMV